MQKIGYKILPEVYNRVNHIWKISLKFAEVSSWIDPMLEGSTILNYNMEQNKSVILAKNGWSSASVCSAKTHAQSWNFRIAVTSFSGWSLITSPLIELPCPSGTIFCNFVNNTKVHIQTPHPKKSEWANNLTLMNLVLEA